MTRRWRARRTRSLAAAIRAEAAVDAWTPQLRAVLAGLAGGGSEASSVLSRRGGRDKRGVLEGPGEVRLEDGLVSLERSLLALVLLDHEDTARTERDVQRGYSRPRE
jgi:hypothetical protein